MRPLGPGFFYLQIRFRFCQSSLQLCLFSDQLRDPGIPLLHFLLPCYPDQGQFNILDVDVPQCPANVGDDIAHLLVADLAELHPLDCIGEGVCYILYLMLVQVLPSLCILTVEGTWLVTGFPVTTFARWAWPWIRSRW